MWGYVKSIVYQSPVTEIDDQKKRFTDAIMATIHAVTLLRTCQGPEYRLDDARSTKAVQCVVYQSKLKTLRILLHTSARCMCLGQFV